MIVHDLGTIQALNAEAVKRKVDDERVRLVADAAERVAALRAEFDERVAAVCAELAVRLAELDEIVGELG